MDDWIRRQPRAWLIFEDVARSRRHEVERGAANCDYTTGSRRSGRHVSTTQRRADRQRRQEVAPEPKRSQCT
jgi:hypothetical protein